jgi:hypothetical protein
MARNDGKTSRMLIRAIKHALSGKYEHVFVYGMNQEFCDNYLLPLLIHLLAEAGHPADCVRRPNTQVRVGSCWIHLWTVNIADGFHLAGFKDYTELWDHAC